MKKIIFHQDKLQTKLLQAAARIASCNALRHSKALDLEITYIENGSIIIEQPDGHRKIVKKLEKVKSPIALTKGMILRAN